MFLYWPVLLAAISAFILFVPLPVLYHKSREWWAFSNVHNSLLRRPYTWLTLGCSFDSSLLASILWNSAISSLAICTVHKRTLWASVVPGQSQAIVLIVLQNLEVFFCLYAHNWNYPAQCNSQHSRILGALSTLPGIWRGLQCLRRYYDTRNAFPHLVNFGKYTFTILCYMTLSLYRIDKTFELKALFITCATINSVYCCKSCPVSPPGNVQS